MARLTGLEPATPGVTGRYSNQLSYNRVRVVIRPTAKARQAGITRFLYKPARGGGPHGQTKARDRRLPLGHLAVVLREGG